VNTVPWPDHLLSLAEWEQLPEDTSHKYELSEGALLVVPRPVFFHQRATARLVALLDEQLPERFTAGGDVEVIVEPGAAATVRVPDVVVVRSEVAATNPARFAAGDVLLAVEIVSPGTGRTDRVTKLHEYALAGIPGYWVIDLDPPTTLLAHVLVDGYYEITAQGSGTLELRVPGHSSHHSSDDDSDDAAQSHVTIDLDSLTRR
jgi:Uma2 family endonuclease